MCSYYKKIKITPGQSELIENKHDPTRGKFLDYLSIRKPPPKKEYCMEVKLKSKI